MCKIHKIWYSCGCSATVRLSTCRATRFKYSWDPRAKLSTRKIMCSSKSGIELAAQSKCGPCLYEPFRKVWDARIAGVEDEMKKYPGSDEGAELEDRLADLKDVRHKEEWACKKMFPTTIKERPSALKGIGEKVCERSPLSRELLPEDIEDVTALHMVYFSTFDDYCMDKYMWMGPQLDLAKLLNEGNGEEKVSGEDQNSVYFEWKILQAEEIDWGEWDRDMSNLKDRTSEVLHEPENLLEKGKGAFEPEGECSWEKREQKETGCWDFNEMKASAGSIERGFELQRRESPGKLSIDGTTLEGDGLVRLWLNI
jgi:hypothetical protein